MKFILLIGSAQGCGIGGMLSRHITIENLNQVYYDTSFSNVADVELELTPEEGMEGAGIIRIVQLELFLHSPVWIGTP